MRRRVARVVVADPLAVARARVVVFSRPSLGDMLQKLTRIAPEDVASVTLIVRDVLREAERRHRRCLPHDL